MVVIECEQLGYCYDSLEQTKKNALKDVNLKIEERDYVTIIGHTGSGKTTLLNHFNGRLKPTSGRLYINGVDVWEDKKTFSQIRKQIGFVFQNPAYQLFEESVEKDIAFGPKNLGLDETEIKRRIKEVSQIVGIDESLLSKSPFDLSGGQKRRVAIAGILAMYPKILLLDEPTSGLDPKGKRQILNIVKEYNEKFNATVIVVTHSMEDIYLYANKVLILNDGEVFSFGGVKETFKNMADLNKIGLDIPEISKIFLKLKERGFNLPTDVYSVEDAINIVKNIILNKEKKC